MPARFGRRKSRALIVQRQKLDVELKFPAQITLVIRGRQDHVGCAEIVQQVVSAPMSQVVALLYQILDIRTCMKVVIQDVSGLLAGGTARINQDTFDVVDEMD